MINYQFRDIEKLRKEFLEAKPIEDDTWLHENVEDFYKILESLDLKRNNKVLYIGTGSGFGTYVNSNLVGKEGEIYSYEINKNEMECAKENIKKIGGVDNINLIIADGLSQPHIKEYFDRIILAAGGRLEIPRKENQIIMKKDIKKNGLLNHLVKQTKIGGIIILPMGELHTRWFTECHGDVYQIRNFKDYLEISVIEQKSSGFWTPLEGENGFSRKEMKENYIKEGSLFDEIL